MRERSPLTVVLAFLVPVALLWHTVGWVRDTIDRREESRRFAVIDVRATPVAASLKALPLPEGLRRCVPLTASGRLGRGLCWAGGKDPVRSALLLTNALRQAGATDVTTECRRSPSDSTVWCVVRGDLQGVPVLGLARPSDVERGEVVLRAAPYAGELREQGGDPFPVGFRRIPLPTPSPPP